MPSSSYYDPGEQRATKVRALFSRVADKYDLLNDLQSFGFHRRWKQRVVQMANPKPGTRALDVCCGTGDIAFALAEKGAEVVGLDFTEGMLARAEQRRAGLPADRDKNAVRFMQGDAERLPFPDNSFDIVTMGYGLRNLKSWETGLREMFRVARPGGRVVALEFGKPEQCLWRAIYLGYLKLFVPILGKAACGDAQAYAYILESLREYPGQNAIAEKMRECGMKNVQILNLVGGAMSINYGER
jgi:demethylmenaquinone methyltransferase / 2-methoxy-6-polyprenyl-1,4-benzoquinol methylase